MFSPSNQFPNTLNRSLYARNGEKKYLSEPERKQFLKAAYQQDRAAKLLCLTLVYSGCRLSEALNLTQASILADENALLIRSLKKRSRTMYRRVPLPHALITELMVHKRYANEVIFPWARTRALHHIKQVMSEANITGVSATARGLRHTFATHGILTGVPLHLIQRWMGHTKIEITAIYADVLGEEEREIAKRMWTK